MSDEFRVTDIYGRQPSINGQRQQVELNYDPWGRRRAAADWSSLDTSTVITDLPVWHYRGYTGHEHLSDFGLINMNGRCYDPALGRMLSIDNFVQDESNPINYNRYAYVLNNPLKYVDLSGEYITRYEDEDRNLLIDTDDGNDATVVVANDDVSEFIQKTVDLVVNGGIDDAFSNDQLIRLFGQRMDAVSGMNVPQWSIDAINGGNGATLSQSHPKADNNISTLGATGTMLTLNATAASTGAFTMYSKNSKFFGEGSWYSLTKGKSYSTTLYGNYYTGWRAGAKQLSNVLTGVGCGLGALNAVGVEYQYQNGEIGRNTWILEQGSNAISTIGGIYGAAWRIGWEAGRAITNIPGYHQNVRMPMRRAFNIQ